MCRAWHVACEVRVLAPGEGAAFVLGCTAATEADLSGIARSATAEGKRKGKGVVVRRGPEEAQRESTGRCTRTGSEVWHTWDQRARDLRSPPFSMRVCFIDPASAC